MPKTLPEKVEASRKVPLQTKIKGRVETGRKRASKRTSSISAKKQASLQTMPISEEKRMSAHIASIVVPTTKSWAAFALVSPSISKGENQSFGDSEPSLSP